MFSDKLIKIFQNPKNVGEIENADAIGHAENPDYGYIINFWIKTVPSDGEVNNCKIIEDIRFKTVGCGPLIASASMITCLVKGKSIVTALELKPGKVINELGGVPKEKKHTVILALKALNDGLKKIKG